MMNAINQKTKKLKMVSVTFIIYIDENPLSLSLAFLFNGISSLHTVDDGDANVMSIAYGREIYEVLRWRSQRRLINSEKTNWCNIYKSIELW